MKQRKIALITGANSGIGLATSIELAKMNIEVIMLCRNEKKGLESKEIVKIKSQSDHVHLKICDLGNLNSVRSIVKEIKSEFHKLDILINNAGVVSPKRLETTDGFEYHLGINHLGHFLLTNLLLENLLNSEQGRIINVSSGAYKWAEFYVDDPHLTKSYNLFKAYGQSKLANILFTKELAKRMKNTNVTANSLHPGAVSTNIGIDRKTGFGTMVHKILSPFFKTPFEGAETSIYLATSPNVSSVTGEYFVDKKIKKLSKTAKNEEVAKLLWEWSAKETKLKTEEI